MYTELVAQQRRELGHVANLVGGFVKNNIWYGDGNRVYDPIPAPRQRDAIRFLNENAFQVAPALVATEILDRLESHGAADRILDGQRSLLRMLLVEPRISRMAEFANRAGTDAYLPAELIDDLHAGIWGELKSESIAIDLYRRNLQRAFVEILIGDLDPPRTNSDVTALARGELQRTLREIAENLDKCRDTTSRYHLADVRARISQALEPRTRPPAPGPWRVVSDPEAM
jgi:hypothetical protein